MSCEWIIKVSNILTVVASWMVCYQTVGTQQLFIPAFVHVTLVCENVIFEGKIQKLLFITLQTCGRQTGITVHFHCLTFCIFWQICWNESSRLNTCRLSISSHVIGCRLQEKCCTCIADGKTVRVVRFTDSLVDIAWIVTFRKSRRGGADGA